MARISKKLEEAKGGLVMLKYTKKILDDDLKIPQWKDLKEDYDDTEDSIDRVVLSIKNSIMSQKRVYFCITREGIGELVRGDKNWQHAGFDNNKYKSVLKLINEVGLAKAIVKGHGRKPYVFQVIDKELITYFGVNLRKQRMQALRFVGDKTADYKTDTVASSKEGVTSQVVTSQEEVRNEKIEDRSETSTGINENLKEDSNADYSRLPLLEVNCIRIPLKDNDIFITHKNYHFSMMGENMIFCTQNGYQIVNSFCINSEKVLEMQLSSLWKYGSLELLPRLKLTDVIDFSYASNSHREKLFGSTNDKVKQFLAKRNQNSSE